MGFHLYLADFTYNLRIPLTLPIPRQLNLIFYMSYFLFVDSTKFSGFRNYGCGFPNFAYFWSDSERYSVVGICLWIPKHQRRSKKSSDVADSEKTLILVCCGIRLQSTECTVWPHNDLYLYIRPKLYHAKIQRAALAKLTKLKVVLVTFNFLVSICKKERFPSFIESVNQYFPVFERSYRFFF